MKLLGKNPLPNRRHQTPHVDPNEDEKEDESDAGMIPIIDVCLPPLKISLPPTTDYSSFAQVIRAFVVLSQLESLTEKPTFLKMFSPLPHKAGFSPVHVQIDDDSLFSMILQHEELTASSAICCSLRDFGASTLDSLPEKVIEKVRTTMGENIKKGMPVQEAIESALLFKIVADVMNSIESDHVLHDTTRVPQSKEQQYSANPQYVSKFAQQLQMDAVHVLALLMNIVRIGFPNVVVPKKLFSDDVLIQAKSMESEMYLRNAKRLSPWVPSNDLCNATRNLFKRWMWMKLFPGYLRVEHQQRNMFMARQILTDGYSVSLSFVNLNAEAAKDTNIARAAERENPTAVQKSQDGIGDKSRQMSAALSLESTENINTLTGQKTGGTTDKVPSWYFHVEER